jgi:hypothetical protein
VSTENIDRIVNTKISDKFCFCAAGITDQRK